MHIGLLASVSDVDSSVLLSLPPTTSLSQASAAKVNQNTSPGQGKKRDPIQKLYRAVTILRIKKVIRNGGEMFRHLTR
jgi:hypothetical protein